MGNDRRVRRLVVDGTVWYWTVRQRVRPDYADCRVTLSLFPEASGVGVNTRRPRPRGGRRRLSLVFAPGPHHILSNCFFEAGTVVRLPDQAWLNLYAPGTVRRLLGAAAPAPEIPSPPRDLEVDGWSFFSAVVDHAGSGTDPVAGRAEPEGVTRER
ncbi:hypothetical protein [Streptomyces sp. NPDC055642]